MNTIALLFVICFYACNSSTEEQVDVRRIETISPTNVDKILPEEKVELKEAKNNADNAIAIPFQYPPQIVEAWEAQNIHEEEEKEQKSNCCNNFFVVAEETYRDYIWHTRYYLNQKKCGKKCRKIVKFTLIPVLLPVAFLYLYPDVTMLIGWLVFAFGLKPGTFEGQNTVRNCFLAAFILGILFRVSQIIKRKVYKKVDRFVDPYHNVKPKKKWLNW